MTMADSTTTDSNFKNTEAPKPKQTKGRMKIPIKKIQNKNKKHVTFSKRRSGLFKKATELCVLCGASVAIITFSEAGKVFTFGHPTTDAVIRRYLNAGDGASASSAALAIGAAANSQSEGGEDRRLLWWDRPVEELGFEELEAYKVSLEQIRSRVEKRITDLDAESHQLKLNVKTDFDYEYEHPLPSQAVSAMVPTSNLMNGYYGFNNGVHGGLDPAIGFGSSEFVSTPAPPPGQNQMIQYCGCGCMGDDYDEGISSIIAMAKFNRSGLGFGEY